MDMLRLAQADSLTNLANTARVINAVCEDRHWTSCNLSMEYEVQHCAFNCTCVIMSKVN
jgi:hypothetical protein